jgi:hypothetical protein
LASKLGGYNTYIALTTLKFWVMDGMSHFNHGNKEEAEVLKRLMIIAGKYIAGAIASDMQ